ncbi:hypothetical protein GJU39_13715 [Pedobacter petrophilus]|uniref:Uncharacterized protein n=1 Tax=Pedobacter petrophilus TaxID=1908241 RepID=A0A7K0G039_9SPHI|nr:hypothetical protein [Pedobacter petrophilus]MRX77145.1 hypothetical protein [Pedobacter petrophilus]
MANPTINQNGTATITPSQNCTITTSSGVASTINTVNTSTSNNLMVVISGVPTGASVFVNGQPSTYLNGLFTVPANSPSFAIVVYGTLMGAVITIQNNTSSAVPASALITCVTA